MTSVRGTDASGCAVRRSAASASATPAAKVVHAAMSATVRASVVTLSWSIEIDSRGNPTVCRSSMPVDRPPVARGTRTCALVGHEPTSGSRHNAAAEWCEKTVPTGAASDTALTRARYLWSPLRAFQSDARMYTPGKRATNSPRATEAKNAERSPGVCSCRVRWMWSIQSAVSGGMPSGCPAGRDRPAVRSLLADAGLTV